MRMKFVTFWALEIFGVSMSVLDKKAQILCIAMFFWLKKKVE